MDSEGSSGEESEDDEGSMTSSSASSTFCTSSSLSFSSSPSSSSDTDQSCVSSDDEHSKLGSLCKSLLENKTPLYPDSQVTILDSYILLYEYSLQHSLTKEAFKELLQLITIHMSLNAKSVYLLQGFFEKHFNDAKGECFYYYSKCHRSVDEGALCPSGCSTTISKFLYVPVEPQLKRRLEGKNCQGVVTTIGHVLPFVTAIKMRSNDQMGLQGRIKRSRHLASVDQD